MSENSTTPPDGWKPKLHEVSVEEIGIEFIDCPVCGGKKTVGQECFDERICKANVKGDLVTAMAVLNERLPHE
jgi:hypothetical protein